MGQTESAPDLGYHVLQVAPNSPGEKAGLVPYFDFIVSVNEQPLKKEDKILENTLNESIGELVHLYVFNNRTETYRKVVVQPSKTWGGAGVAGISIRFCTYYNATSYVWHVLDVHPNSPAAEAGLEPHTDYIVGTIDIVFNSGEDFYTFINVSIGKVVPLYVFSSQTNRVRLVSITPNRIWGGNGCLGCDVGYGYLHRIPSPPQLQPSQQQLLQEYQQPQQSNIVESVHLTTVPLSKISTSPIIEPNEFSETEKLAQSLQYNEGVQT
eukprot:TRINITY_DN5212_c0_g1_i2.p1 TRINITY_DN5212_c0_g1~~TRINITY_DN5212_c0_g1_i2.p1  ORF type:complete len:274 (-),score=33.70 TRINITY_DN5212_c0_g1_i2:46-846(-)